MIRRKTTDDASQCFDLLLQVHESDGYPMYLPVDVPVFITPEYEVASWVAERDGCIIGHVALHQASVDPTLAAAQRATGLPVERLAVVSRLFTSPSLRRAGIGRSLLRYATDQATARGQRAVLGVGKTLSAPVALYESEGWERVDSPNCTSLTLCWICGSTSARRPPTHRSEWHAWNAVPGCVASGQKRP